jgi:predicted DNA-binding transcriptional regulator AlpA
MTTTESLILAVLSATEERKEVALKVLRGDIATEQNTVRGKDTETYVTLREVGRRLGVSACSLWRWGVPGHELGGRRRFRMSEIEAYLKSEAFRKRAADLKEYREVLRKAGR